MLTINDALALLNQPAPPKQKTVGEIAVERHLQAAEGFLQQAEGIEGQVAYRGPMPSYEEYADATLAAATEAMLEAGADPEEVGFTLRHVPQALATLSTAASIDHKHINPYLLNAGVGLNSQGKKIDSPAKLNMSLGRNGKAEVDVITLDKERGRRVTPAELRRLCIDFQQSVAMDSPRVAVG